MEFFGITYYGPQNYIKDITLCDYKEPMSVDEVKPLMETVKMCSTCPPQIERPDYEAIRFIDCYTGRVNGFAYGSKLRFEKMKIKGILHPTGPADIYRISPTTSMDYGQFICDPVLEKTTWQQTNPRYPQPMSPNTRTLDAERKNNKYATFF